MIARGLWCFVLVAFSTPACAYLDPGTGSMLVTAMVGVVATILFSLKGLYYSSLRRLVGFFGGKIEVDTIRPRYVFYSEGQQYWTTFKPVIEELIARGESCTFLTSDEDDPGLSNISELVNSRYIGTGTRAYSYLRFLEADICVMTTPGLDVLQIKRSKGVKHYAHLIHAPTDTAIYKTYSFDYFDSVFLSGDHQCRSIRKLEELRGTPPKKLPITGCLYFDEMKTRMRKPEVLQSPSKSLTVLVAPTWGANGLLEKYGPRLLALLLEQHFEVILRPHPQSFISEGEMIDDLWEELKHFENLQLDRERDAMEAMALADVMVSDQSGVVFDFAFLFEKPVITLKSDLVTEGLEAADLPWLPWELTVLDVIGKQLDGKNLENLPELVSKVVKSGDKSNDIRQLRDSSVANFGCAAKYVVNELLRIDIKES